MKEKHQQPHIKISKIYEKENSQIRKYKWVLIHKMMLNIIHKKINKN